MNGVLRGNAPRSHTHTPRKCRGYEPRGVWTETHASSQSGQALVDTCERRGKCGNSLSQDTQGGTEYTLCCDRIPPHRAYRQQRRQRISVGHTKRTNAIHSPCCSSWHKLRGGQHSHRCTMRARRQPRRQESLAEAGTHVWRT